MERHEPLSWRERRLHEVVADARETVRRASTTIEESRALLARTPCGLIPGRPQLDDPGRPSP